MMSPLRTPHALSLPERWSSLDRLRRHSRRCPPALRPRLGHILELLELLLPQAELLGKAGVRPALERAAGLALPQTLERYAALPVWSAWLLRHEGRTAHQALAEYLSQLERVLLHLHEASLGADLERLRLEGKTLEEGFHQPLRFRRR